MQTVYASIRQVDETGLMYRPEHNQQKDGLPNLLVVAVLKYNIAGFLFWLSTPEKLRSG